MIAELLLQRLEQLEGSHRPSRYLVAFSGGLDSTVLLHALWQGRERHGVPIAAVHINHGLHPDAERWAGQCRRFAERLGVPFLDSNVDIPANDRRGPEGAAREIRYAAMKEFVTAGDHLLTAHHEEDQAETLLLNLLRGSGAAGLAGIGAVQSFGDGLLLRPLLGVSHRDIQSYAARHRLEWCDDPSNRDIRYDRNFLRREILPALRRRWPAVSARLRRSAELMAETAELQDDLAQLDLADLEKDPGRLDIAGLMRLSATRQRNALRFATRRLCLPSAPSTRLDSAVRELIPAAPDAQPIVRWPGGEFRRYRGTLYILPTLQYLIPSESLTLSADGRECRLDSSLGALQLEENVAGGIDPGIVDDGLAVRFRQGGEKIRPVGRKHSHSLKKLLQEAGVVPWMRAFVPLLYANERLVAVGDLWIADEAHCAQGFAVRWRYRPPLF